MSYLNKWIEYERRKTMARKLRKDFPYVLEPFRPVFVGAVSSQKVNLNIPLMNASEYVTRVVDLQKDSAFPRPMIYGIVDTGAKSRSKYLQKNFVEGGRDHTDEAEPIDNNDHLSHCASSVVGSDFNMGIWNCSKMLPSNWMWMAEKGLASYGAGTSKWLSNALQALLDRTIPYLRDGYGAVWSLSWGSPVLDHNIQSILDDASARGIVIVCSAGNNPDAGVMYPAGIESVFSCGAVDKNKQRASFSASGIQNDVVGVGVAIWGADRTPDGTVYFNGTSMSAPNVAAALGLVMAANPDVRSFSDIYKLVEEHSLDLGKPGLDDVYGFGFIDLNSFPVAKPGTPVSPPPVEEEEEEEEEEENPSEEEIVNLVFDSSAVSVFVRTEDEFKFLMTCEVLVKTAGNYDEVFRKVWSEYVKFFARSRFVFQGEFSLTKLASAINRYFAGKMNSQDLEVSIISMELKDPSGPKYKAKLPAFVDLVEILDVSVSNV